MQISASIFSNKNKSIESLIKDLEAFEINTLHIDCNDDIKVFDEINSIRSISQLPVDIHIIAENPALYYSAINAAKPKMCCFQLEKLKEVVSFDSIQVPLKGMAITIATDMTLLERYIDKIQYLLIMTTVPGQSGGVFPAEAFRYIRQIQQRYPHLKIQVDGGVNHEVSFILRLLGVDGIVSGSYLVNHENIGVAYIQLTSKQIPSHFHVSDFMIPMSELPVVQQKDASLNKLLQANEDFKMGCCMVIDESNHLMGLSTNADIRKGLLKNNLDILQGNIHDFMNTNPLTIRPNHTIGEMLEIIKSVSFPVLLLPVMEENRTLRGIVLFNKLIKGE
jgi:pentose-5-phosphate-3-epimerase